MPADYRAMLLQQSVPAVPMTAPEGTSWTADELRVNAAFASWLQGGSGAPGQHQPVTFYPAHTYPSAARDFVTQALRYADGTAPVLVDPTRAWPEGTVPLSVMPATKVVVCVSHDRIDRGVIFEPTDEGVFSMFDLEITMDGDVRASELDIAECYPTGASATALAAAETAANALSWTRVTHGARGTVAEQPKLRHVDGAPRDSMLMLLDPAPGFRYTWDSNSMQAVEVHRRTSDDRLAKAQSRTALERANEMQRYLQHADPEKRPLSAIFADEQKRWAPDAALRAKVAKAIALATIKPLLEAAHTTGTRVPDRVASADADAGHRIMRALCEQAASSKEAFLAYLVMLTNEVSDDCGLWPALLEAESRAAIPAAYSGQDPGGGPASYLVRALRVWRQEPGSGATAAQRPRRARVAMARAQLSVSLRDKTMGAFRPSDASSGCAISAVAWAEACILLSGPRAASADGVALRGRLISLLLLELEMLRTYELDATDDELRHEVAAACLDSILLEMEGCAFEVKRCFLLHRPRNASNGLRRHMFALCRHAVAAAPDKHARSWLKQALQNATYNDIKQRRARVVADAKKAGREPPPPPQRRGGRGSRGGRGGGRGGGGRGSGRGRAKAGGGKSVSWAGAVRGDQASSSNGAKAGAGPSSGPPATGKGSKPSPKQPPGAASKAGAPSPKQPATASSKPNAAAAKPKGAGAGTATVPKPAASTGGGTSGAPRSGQTATLGLAPVPDAVAMTAKAIAGWDADGDVQLVYGGDCTESDLLIRTVRLRLCNPEGGSDLHKELRASLEPDDVLDVLEREGFSPNHVVHASFERAGDKLTLLLICDVTEAAVYLRGLCPQRGTRYSPRCDDYRLQLLASDQFGEGLVQVTLETTATIGIPLRAIVAATWHAITVNDCQRAGQHRAGMPKQSVTTESENFNTWSLVAYVPTVSVSRPAGGPVPTRRVQTAGVTLLLKVHSAEPVTESTFADVNDDWDGQEHTPKHELRVRLLDDGRERRLKCFVHVAERASYAVAAVVAVVAWRPSVEATLTLLDDMGEFLGHGKRHALTLWEALFHTMSSSSKVRKDSARSHRSAANLTALRTVLTCMGVRVPWTIAVPPLWHKLTRAQAEALIAGVLTTASARDWGYDARAAIKTAEKLARVEGNVKAQAPSWPVHVRQALGLPPIAAEPAEPVADAAHEPAAVAGSPSKRGKGAPRAASGGGKAGAGGGTPSPAKAAAALIKNVAKAEAAIASTFMQTSADAILAATSEFQMQHRVACTTPNDEQVNAIVGHVMQLHIDRASAAVEPVPTLLELRQIGEWLASAEGLEAVARAGSAFYTVLPMAPELAAWVASPAALYMSSASQPGSVSFAVPSSIVAAASASAPPARSSGELTPGNGVLCASGKRLASQFAAMTAPMPIVAVPAPSTTVVRMNTLDSGRPRRPPHTLECVALVLNLAQLLGVGKLELLHAPPGEPLASQVPVSDLTAHYGHPGQNTAEMSVSPVQKGDNVSDHAGVLVVMVPTGQTGEGQLTAELDSLYLALARHTSTLLAMCGSDKGLATYPGVLYTRDGNARTGGAVNREMRAAATRGAKKLRELVMYLMIHQPAEYMQFMFAAVYYGNQCTGGDYPNIGLTTNEITTHHLAEQLRERHAILEARCTATANAGSPLELMSAAYATNATIEVLASDSFGFDATYTTSAVYFNPRSNVVIRLCTAEEDDIADLRWTPAMALHRTTLRDSTVDNETHWAPLPTGFPPAPQTPPAASPASPPPGQQEGAAPAEATLGDPSEYLRGVHMPTRECEWDPCEERQEGGCPLYTANDEPASATNLGMVADPRILATLTPEQLGDLEGARLVGATDGAAPKERQEATSLCATYGAWLSRDPADGRDGGTEGRTDPEDFDERDFKPFWETSELVYGGTDEEPNQLTIRADNVTAELVGATVLVEAANKLKAASVLVIVDYAGICEMVGDQTRPRPRDRVWYERLMRAIMQMRRRSNDADAAIIVYFPREKNTRADALANVPLPPEIGDGEEEPNPPAQRRAGEQPADFWGDGGGEEFPGEDAGADGMDGLEAPAPRGGQHQQPEDGSSERGRAAARSHAAAPKAAALLQSQLDAQTAAVVAVRAEMAAAQERHDNAMAAAAQQALADRDTQAAAIADAVRMAVAAAMAQAAPAPAAAAVPARANEGADGAAEQAAKAAAEDARKAEVAAASEQAAREASQAAARATALQQRQRREAEELRQRQATERAAAASARDVAARAKEAATQLANEAAAQLRVQEAAAAATAQAAVRRQDELAAAQVAAAAAAETTAAAGAAARAGTSRPGSLAAGLQVEYGDSDAVGGAAEMQRMGEILYPLISASHPERAGKITGMLLDLGHPERVLLCTGHEGGTSSALKAAVLECVATLDKHDAELKLADKHDDEASPPPAAAQQAQQARDRAAAESQLLEKPERARPTAAAAASAAAAAPRAGPEAQAKAASGPHAEAAPVWTARHDSLHARLTVCVMHITTDEPAAGGWVSTAYWNAPNWAPNAAPAKGRAWQEAQRVEGRGHERSTVVTLEAVGAGVLWALQRARDVHARGLVLQLNTPEHETAAFRAIVRATSEEQVDAAWARIPQASAVHVRKGEVLNLCAMVRTLAEPDPTATPPWQGIVVEQQKQRGRAESKRATEAARSVLPTRHDAARDAAAMVILSQPSGAEILAAAKAATRAFAAKAYKPHRAALQRDIAAACEEDGDASHCEIVTAYARAHHVAGPASNAMKEMVNSMLDALRGVRAQLLERAAEHHRHVVAYTTHSLQGRALRVTISSMARLLMPHEGEAGAAACRDMADATCAAHDMRREALATECEQMLAAINSMQQVLCMAPEEYSELRAGVRSTMPPAAKALAELKTCYLNQPLILLWHEACELQQTVVGFEAPKELRAGGLAPRVCEGTPDWLVFAAGVWQRLGMLWQRTRAAKPNAPAARVLADLLAGCTAARLDMAKAHAGQDVTEGAAPLALVDYCNAAGVDHPATTWCELEWEEAALSPQTAAELAALCVDEPSAVEARHRLNNAQKGFKQAENAWVAAKAVHSNLDGKNRGTPATTAQRTQVSANKRRTAAVKARAGLRLATEEWIARRVAEEWTLVQGVAQAGLGGVPTPEAEGAALPGQHAAASAAGEPAAGGNPGGDDDSDDGLEPRAPRSEYAASACSSAGSLADFMGGYEDEGEIPAGVELLSPTLQLAKNDLVLLAHTEQPAYCVDSEDAPPHEVVWLARVRADVAPGSTEFLARWLTTDPTKLPADVAVPYTRGDWERIPQSMDCVIARVAVGHMHGYMAFSLSRDVYEWACEAAARFVAGIDEHDGRPATRSLRVSEPKHAADAYLQLDEQASAPAAAVAVHAPSFPVPTAASLGADRVATGIVNDQEWEFYVQCTIQNTEWHSLQPRQWLSQDVVNTFLQLTVRATAALYPGVCPDPDNGVEGVAARTAHAVNTYVWGQLTPEGGVDIARRAHLVKVACAQIDGFSDGWKSAPRPDSVLLPAHDRVGGHWADCTLTVQTPAAAARVDIMDSLRAEGQAWALEDTAVWFLSAIHAAIIAMPLATAGGEASAAPAVWPPALTDVALTTELSTVLRVVRAVPQQLEVDCGVCTCWNALQSVVNIEHALCDTERTHVWTRGADGYALEEGKAAFDAMPQMRAMMVISLAADQLCIGPTRVDEPFQPTAAPPTAAGHAPTQAELQALHGEWTPPVVSEPLEQLGLPEHAAAPHNAAASDYEVSSGSDVELEMEEEDGHGAQGPMQQSAPLCAQAGEPPGARSEAAAARPCHEPQCDSPRGHLCGHHCTAHALAAGCEVRESEIEGAGMGLFAVKKPAQQTNLTFTETEVITVYTGSVVHGPGEYVMKGRDGTMLDAVSEDSGIGRYANHSEDANAQIGGMGVANGEPYIEIIATRGILVGEEITINYGEDYVTDFAVSPAATVEAPAATGLHNKQAAAVAAPPPPGVQAAAPPEKLMLGVPPPEPQTVANRGADPARVKGGTGSTSTAEHIANLSAKLSSGVATPAAPGAGDRAQTRSQKKPLPAAQTAALSDAEVKRKQKIQKKEKKKPLTAEARAAAQLDAAPQVAALGGIGALGGIAAKAPPTVPAGAEDATTAAQEPAPAAAAAEGAEAEGAKVVADVQEPAASKATRSDVREGAEHLLLRGITDGWIPCGRMHANMLDVLAELPAKGGLAVAAMRAVAEWNDALVAAHQPAVEAVLSARRQVDVLAQMAVEHQAHVQMTAQEPPDGGGPPRRARGERRSAVETARAVCAGRDTAELCEGDASAVRLALHAALFQPQADGMAPFVVIALGAGPEIVLMDRACCAHGEVVRVMISTGTGKLVPHEVWPAAGPHSFEEGHESLTALTDVVARFTGSGNEALITSRPAPRAAQKRSESPPRTQGEADSGPNKVPRPPLAAHIHGAAPSPPRPSNELRKRAARAKVASAAQADGYERVAPMVPAVTAAGMGGGMGGMAAAEGSTVGSGGST